MRKNFKIIIGALFLSLTAFGQNTVSKQISDPFTLSGEASFPGIHAPITVDQDPVLAPQRHRVKEANFYVHVFVDETYSLGNAFESVSLSMDIVETTGGGSVSTVPLTFDFDQNKVEQIYKYNFTDELSIETVQFELASITSPTITVSGADALLIENYIKEHITITAWYEVDYGVDIREDDLEICQEPEITILNGTELSARVQTFNWSNVHDVETYHFPNYEFQLLKLENEDPTADPTIQQTKTIVDWSKALTLETYNSETELTMTIAQGSGFYLWRVRPIGDYYSGGIADSRNWGLWSDAPANGDEINLNIGYYASSQATFLFKDPDNDMNWIYSRVFTENGNMHEGMTYANSLLQPVQSQAYSSSTGQVITSESVLDYLGRPAFSALPIPQTGTLDGFKDDFIINAAGEKYTAADFDADDNIDNPSVVRQNSGDIFDYYSDENPDQSIPDAHGYPYSRTIFKTDGSGRPSEQGGVGKVHAIGQITDGKTHTTKVYYSTPTDHELIAVFGDEAPPAANVLKTSTVDPNGTVNIIYTTLEGKTIATAMSHISADNLLDIDDLETNQLGVLLLEAEGITSVNTFLGNMFFSIKTLSFVHETEIILNYNIDCYVLEDAGCGTPDCDYKLLFRIMNQKTGNFYTSSEISLAGNCGSDISFDDVFWTKSNIDMPDLNALGHAPNLLTLSEGDWKIMKIVKSAIDPDNIHVNTPLGKLGPLMDLVASWMGSVASADEYDLFMTKVTEFEEACSTAHANATVCPIVDGDYNTPCYQGYFDLIRADYELDDDFIFDPTYQLELPTIPDSDEKYISFTTGDCCEDISVDIPTVPVHAVCAPIDEEIEAGTLIVDDINYSQLFKEFFDEMVDNGEFDIIPTMADTWADASPGYGVLTEVVIDGETLYTSDMDEMIYQMLTDQYYVGKGYHNGTDWVTWESKDDAEDLIYPIPVDADPILYGPHYSCNELYNCWLASMRAYFDMLDLKNKSFDIYALVNEDQNPDGEDEDEDGEPDDPAGDHYDDEESQPEDKSFMDWMTDWIVSQKMKKFSKESAGLDGDPDVDGMDNVPQFAYQLNIPDLFLECTGKQIAAIVSPEISDELNYNIYTTDNYNGDTENRVYAEDEDGVALDPAQLIYPYIVKPIWAFKYYEYYPGVVIDNVALTANVQTYPMGGIDDDIEMNKIASLEISQCYHNIGVGVNLCYKEPCEGGHHNWSATERINFYNVIENAYEDPFTPVDPDPGDGLTCPDATELLAMRQAKFDAAKDACDDRVTEFKLGIEYMLVINCYEVVLCDEGADNTVTEAEVTAMTTSVVDGCKTYVDLIQSSCETFTPTCTDHSCTMWTGTAFESQYELLIELFDPANKTEEKLYYVKYGDFIPQMKVEDCKCEEGCDDLDPDWYDSTLDCSSETPTAIEPAP